MSRQIIEPTIILEHVYEGKPGEGFEAFAQYEAPGIHKTEGGYYGQTEQAALLRFIVDKAQMTSNLAMALAEDASMLLCLAHAFSEKTEIDLINMPRPKFTTAEERGLPENEILRQKVNELSSELDSLCRCTHGRRYKETCCYCPDGVSVGGIYNGKKAGEAVESATPKNRE